ncbi:MAG: hypothetical protein C4305_08260 [Thermoleophilia bacterium]
MAEPTTRLFLRVSPGAGRDEIVGRHGRGWKARVREAPEQGRANEALARLLAHRLRLPRAQVAVVAGLGSRDKVVEVWGLAPEEAVRRLEGVS